MKVSVVVCCHTLERLDDLRDAFDSLLGQTYDDIEVVFVSDGNDELYRRIDEDYGDIDDFVTVVNDENIGLSASRNRGIEASSGDVVAFMDDDAVADESWVDVLVKTYEEHDAVAVGGRMTPIWVDGEPSHLPEEFYWLIGVTHRGFAGGRDEVQEVRNTFGSNISFRRYVLGELAGFDTSIGREGDAHLQAEEPELCARMMREYGRGVVYNPDAKVGHKVFEYRTRTRWLLNRAFWQGYSKRAMEKLVPDADIGEEGAYLSMLVFSATPRLLHRLVTRPSFSVPKKIVMLYALTAAVGFGYLYAVATYRR
ncbi:MAG: glucosyl-dolichyl phosphate glucuronosyltransferase [Halobacteriales archaeon]|nr:glucosyl-dolichyl phosphate glucuronosyltransferase [Halobacteriales archaeon]